ncbi:MAG: flagellin [Proteobacteria bacterium]|nr:flagellin [Pseudomonadota bacterium]
MAVVNTNANASIAQNALARNERAMNTAMERLSTGQRINTAGDDAAGLAIASRMTSQIRGLEVGIRNANDAISMISTADGALIEVTNMLQRMRELALQASNGTGTSADRAYLSQEYANLLSEIDRIAENTQWNGMSILNHTTDASSKFAFQVGANGGQTIEVQFGDFTNTASGVFAGLATGSHGTISHATTASAIVANTSAVNLIDTAITAVNSQRATFGAAMNQLTYAVDNLSNVQVNAQASRSRILDADYAVETSELARTQIIQQAGTAMLAQANQLPQTVLSLLQ